MRAVQIVHLKSPKDLRRTNKRWLMWGFQGFLYVKILMYSPCFPSAPFSSALVNVTRIIWGTGWISQEKIDHRSAQLNLFVSFFIPAKSHGNVLGSDCWSYHPSYWLMCLFPGLPEFSPQGSFPHFCPEEDSVNTCPPSLGSLFRNTKSPFPQRGSNIFSY